MTLTFKSKPYKDGFEPFCPEVYRVPFPDSYRLDEEECFNKLQQTIESGITVERTAAVLFEPVLGEGGFIAMSKNFAQKLSRYCRERGILLIADEIQTGFGRTGTLFACEQLGIEPDIVLSAKGLGGGMPISAVTGRAEIMDAPEAGGIGGTFGGNPLSCAAALAVFELFEDQEILSHAKFVGETLGKTLNTWQSDFPRIGVVRGVGPMRAIEFVKDRNSKEPDPSPVKPLIQYCYQNGVVLMSAGTYGNIVRFLVPLTITTEELNEGLNVIGRGLLRVL